MNSPNFPNPSALRISFGIIASVLFSGAVPCSGAELHYPAGVLKHGDLTVRYFLPDGHNGYYRGTRFDWSGIVSRVEYQGHSFFSEFREQHDPLNHDDICGTAEEFGINTPEGYAQARPGEVFLKPGIGLLERPDDTAYSFARRYRIAQEGKWVVKSDRNQVAFTQDFRGSNGWAYSYTKTLIIDDAKPTLTIRRVLRNAGTRAIETDHYGHNFMKIDDVSAGPDYVLEFPFELRLGEGSQTQNCIEARGRSLVFLRPIPKDQAIWLRIEGFRSVEDNRVAVRNTKTGATMEIATDQPLSRMAFFSQFGVLCPEPFVEVKIPPGASRVWQTTYTFSATREQRSGQPNP